jgi:hypothetical protein
MKAFMMNSGDCLLKMELILMKNICRRLFITFNPFRVVKHYFFLTELHSGLFTFKPFGLQSISASPAAPVRPLSPTLQ